MYIEIIGFIKSDTSVGILSNKILVKKCYVLLKAYNATQNRWQSYDSSK